MNLVRQAPDLVGRVAQAIHMRLNQDDLPEGGWPQIMRDAAQAALEASGHACLVETLETIKYCARLAENGTGATFKADFANIRIVANDALATLGSQA
jgi:hypothetical protein